MKREATSGSILAQKYASAADTETELTLATQTVGVVVKLPISEDIMKRATREYARRLHSFWPEAQMWAVLTEINRALFTSQSKETNGILKRSTGPTLSGVLFTEAVNSFSRCFSGSM